MILQISFAFTSFFYSLICATFLPLYSYSVRFKWITSSSSSSFCQIMHTFCIVAVSENFVRGTTVYEDNLSQITSLHLPLQPSLSSSAANGALWCRVLISLLNLPNYPFSIQTCHLNSIWVVDHNDCLIGSNYYASYARLWMSVGSCLYLSHL